MRIIPNEYRRLADIILNHSCEVESGHNVLIQASGCDEEFIALLVEEIHERGASAYVEFTHPAIASALMKGPDAQFDLQGELESKRMEQMDAFIAIRGGDNIFESNDVPSDRRNSFTERIVKPVHFDIRVPKTKWVILRWPTPGMAQQAGMSTREFTKFFFDACTVDYKQMGELLQPLVRRMEQADQVHIKGPGETDLRFSIKDIPVIPCFGERNIPDGECFTAPIRESVQGIMAYNTPTIYDGQSFGNVRLEFRDGKIVDARCESGDVEALNAIFDKDEGARYIGEYSIGVNNQINKAMRDILFDEKIGGSMHFTPGQAYEIADNGNRSVIHWDMVLVQTAAYGGGELWFDGELIRKDGQFVVDDLLGLNPGSTSGAGS